jgi:serine/threonine protein phosphatase PrpC
MKHNIGKYTIRLSGWGKDKYHREGAVMCPENIYYNDNSSALYIEYGIGKHIPDIWMFGQDTFGVYRINDTLITVNADGHGGTKPLLTEGKMMSYYSVLFGILEIYQNTDHIKKIYKNSTLDSFMNSILQKIDNKLMYDFPETKQFTTGGSTLTINIKFTDVNGNLVSITTNAGDSLLVRVDSSGIIEETMELNCDSLEAYQLYVERCNTLGTTPVDVYLSRFNYKNGFEVNWMDNAYMPIMPFKLEKNNDVYTATENIEEMKMFYNNAQRDFYKKHLLTGGIQSIRGMPGNIKKIEEGGYPSTNFGNTAEGICQCLPGSSIGDSVQKNGNRDMMLSHTKIHIYTKRGTEIMGSDGFFDTITDKELVEKTKTTVEEDIRHTLIEHMCFNVNKYKWPIGWDDVTMCVTTVRKNKTKENKFVKKKEGRTRRKNIRK